MCIEPQSMAALTGISADNKNISVFLKKKIKIGMAINTAMRNRSAWRIWTAIINDC